MKIKDIDKNDKNLYLCKSLGTFERFNFMTKVCLIIITLGSYSYFYAIFCVFLEYCNKNAYLFFSTLMSLN